MGLGKDNQQEIILEHSWLIKCTLYLSELGKRRKMSKPDGLETKSMLTDEMKTEARETEENYGEWRTGLV